MSDHDEVIQAENNSAGLVRGRNLSPMSIGHMYAIAQRVLGEHQGLEKLKHSSRLLFEENALPLIAAARILHAISATQKIRDIDQRTILLTKILAASAYAMHGNFSSASAVFKELDLDLVETEAELITLALINPSSRGWLLRDDRLSTWARAFIEALNEILLDGDVNILADLRSMLESFIAKSARPLDAVLLANARLALEHMANLSIAVNLQNRDAPFMQEFVAKLVASGRICFLPPQYEILVENSFGQKKENGIVTLPTSAGKTLIAEFAIAEALSDGPGIALYVVPYVALGNQVCETLKSHFPVDVRVHSLFGGFKSTASLDPINYREIVVVTPERLDAILRFNSIYPFLKVAIFDEAHLIESSGRGTRLESIITRFRLQQKDGCEFRLILLSAVLSDVAALMSWLGPDTIHVSNNWRPTARRIAFWRSDSLNWLYGNDPFRPTALQANDVLSRWPMIWPNPLYPTDIYPQIVSQLPGAYANVGYLARSISQTFDGPVLLVCGTKSTTRELAATLGSALPDKPILGPTVTKLLNVIEVEAPYLRPLANLARKGVAYHNASVPVRIRKLIEDGIRSRELNFISATTTLAEGVDLPFRTTIIFDWLFGFGDRQKPMAALLFRNIAGRCGRAGEFVEGDTLIFDNVFGKAQFTHESVRIRQQRKLFEDPPILESTVANDNLLTFEKEEAAAVLSAQLLAAIPENPNIENVDEWFAANTYSACRGKPALEALKEIRVDLMDESQGPAFARAASPLQLTAVGVAANQTGLSANSCRILLRYLEGVREQAEIARIAKDILEIAGDFPEQQNAILSKLASNTLKRLYISGEDLPYLAEGWLSSIPLEQIFASLPKAIKSKSGVKPSTWIDGSQESDFVSKQFDKFIDVVEFTFGFYLPWVLRACQCLAQVVSNPSARLVDWGELADRFENARHADLETIGLDPESAT